MVYKIDYINNMARKHFFNENYFEFIDSQEKAYWLGFICADGYINIRGNTTGITLDIKDKDHLSKFLKEINSNLMRLDYSNGRFDKNHPLTEKVRITMYSRKMNSDLRKLGITTKKSTELKPILIKDELKSHFIRGYFDGDGCVFENYSKYGKSKEKLCYQPGFTFVGTFEFLTFINDNLPFKVKSLRLDKRTKGSYTLFIASMKRFLLLEEYLYRDSTISLDRKRKKCDIIKEKIKKGSETIPENGSTSK